jgi:hypothetical protein
MPPPGPAGAVEETGATRGASRPLGASGDRQLAGSEIAELFHYPVLLS